MQLGLDNRVQLARSYTISGEMRVCLRLVRVHDAQAVRALLARQGLAAEPLELARLVRFDPRRQLVICASALLGATETILGLGAIRLDASEPDLLLVDDAVRADLRDLLIQALTGRARAVADRRAA